MQYKVTCDVCKEDRLLDNPPRKGRATTCRPCSNKKNIGVPRGISKPKWRICSECGDKKQVANSRDARATMCLPCSNIRNGLLKTGTNSNLPKKRYYYFCPTCPSVRELLAKRKTPYCGHCSRVQQSKKAEAKKIITEKKKKVVKKIKAKIKRIKQIKPKAKSKSYTKIGTDGAKENKVRLTKKEKVIVKIPEEDMIAKWMAKNKVKVIEHKELTGYTDQAMKL